MVLHIREFFPQFYELAGDEAVRRTIISGIEKSALYGITTEPEVCRYIDFVVAFGIGFEEKPQYLWASQILNNQSISAAAKIRQLNLGLAALPDEVVVIDGR